MEIEKRRRRRPRRTGPFARSLTDLDRRTRAAKIMREIVDELTAHCGGNPSAAEALLIRQAAMKATRLHLLSERFLAGTDLAEGSDHHALSWSNSLRLDLAQLGMERRVIKTINPEAQRLLDHFGLGPKTPREPTR